MQIPKRYFMDLAFRFPMPEVSKTNFPQGLSAFNVLQRTKEIGIRKVLGASIQNLLYILSKEFLKLVLISFVIAIPLTWLIMHNWLQDFAYRINIQWWVFALAGIISLFIALITISFQALKAAVANPVNSLRSE